MKRSYAGRQPSNERWAELKSPTQLNISAYEWSAAKQGMDEAWLLAAMSLRASAYVRSAARQVGDSLAGLLRLH